MAARETTGEAIIISGLHSRSRVFISGGNRNLIHIKINIISILIH